MAVSVVCRWLLTLTVSGLVGGTAMAGGLGPPPEIQLPGSQPPETAPLDQDPVLDILLHQDPSVGNNDSCFRCHVGEKSTNEPYSIIHEWRGSMMANASRDPVTWAQLAIVQQDVAGTPVAGAGDVCIRCHIPKGWIEGRSVPANGSALESRDGDGVTCHLCHRLANPDDSEHLGIQEPPYVANSGGGSPEGYYGTAMYVLFQDDEQGIPADDPGRIARLGPYETTDETPQQDGPANPPHAALQSDFHRSSDLCGTCHDVSNPVVGDLAPDRGVAVAGLSPVPAASGVVGDDVDAKAAFRNPPYAYGNEQRTYSEHIASRYPLTPVSQFGLSLPPELRVEGGAPKAAFDAAFASGSAGNYSDGTTRRFTCQSCHLMPARARGGNHNDDLVRSDLPRHDLTGANYWAPQAIAYLDLQDRLMVGGGLDAEQRESLTAGVARARESLARAASLTALDGESELANTIRVTNLTGHKLWTGYPDGRRMWLNVKWFAAGDALVREDCAYGPLSVELDVDGDGEMPDEVRTLIDLDCPESRVWRIAQGVSQPWAERLVANPNPSDGLGADPTTPLYFDRVTGAVARTLGDLAQNPDTFAVEETNHLIFNDVTISDNRIPPWGMDYDEALVRNALPVPVSLYAPGGESPSSGDRYDHFDDVVLTPPAGMGVVRAEVRLFYQPISWEYVQFLWLGNEGPTAAGGDDFLQDVGDDLLEAWLATDMAEPQEMAAIALPEPGAGALALAALVALAAASRARRPGACPEASSRLRGFSVPT